VSFIQIVNEDTAAGAVKDDYAFIAGSYSHAAQVDVYNTVAIQSSLNKLANVLGVSADDEPLLPRSRSEAA
jgi:hypothetical protein